MRSLGYCLGIACLALAACGPQPVEPDAPDTGVTCKRKTCSALGLNCGPTSDGCGGTLACGTCDEPESCGGGGTEGVCGAPCEPKNCSGLGKNCGNVSDGCGETLDCGKCTAPQICGGGGVPNVCAVCTTETDAAFCQRLVKNCGQLTAPDNCGKARTADCGTCAGPETCGGGGLANVCGKPCVPETDPELCARLGKDCDQVSAEDNCRQFRTASCGACQSPFTCAGGGVANVCGSQTCTSESDSEFCQRRGRECDVFSGSDNCGRARTADCGVCALGNTCSAGQCVTPRPDAGSTTPDTGTGLDCRNAPCPPDYSCNYSSGQCYWTGSSDAGTDCRSTGCAQGYVCNLESGQCYWTGSPDAGSNCNDTGCGDGYTCDYNSGQCYWTGSDAGTHFPDGGHCAYTGCGDGYTCDYASGQCYWTGYPDGGSNCMYTGCGAGYSCDYGSGQCYWTGYSDAGSNCMYTGCGDGYSCDYSSGQCYWTGYPDGGSNCMYTGCSAGYTCDYSSGQCYWTGYSDAGSDCRYGGTCEFWEYCDSMTGQCLSYLTDAGVVLPDGGISAPDGGLLGDAGSCRSGDSSCTSSNVFVLPWGVPECGNTTLASDLRDIGGVPACGLPARLGDGAPDQAWKYVPAQSGTVSFYVIPDSAWDVALYVRGPNICNTGSCLAGANDNGPGQSETVTLSVTAGSVYYLHVDGVGYADAGVANSGAYTLLAY